MYVCKYKMCLFCMEMNRSGYNRLPLSSIFCKLYFKVTINMIPLQYYNNGENRLSCGMLYLNWRGLETWIPLPCFTNVSIKQDTSINILYYYPIFSYWSCVFLRWDQDSITSCMKILRHSVFTFSLLEKLWYC